MPLGPSPAESISGATFGARIPPWPTLPWSESESSTNKPPLSSWLSSGHLAQKPGLAGSYSTAYNASADIFQLLLDDLHIWVMICASEKMKPTRWMTLDAVERSCCGKDACWVKQPRKGGHKTAESTTLTLQHTLLDIFTFLDGRSLLIV